MNKEEIITAIAEKTSFSKIDSKKFLDSYVEIVTAALKGLCFMNQRFSKIFISGHN